MNIEKYILAVITTNRDKVFGSAVTFIVEEGNLGRYINNLEAILDGVCHQLDEDVYIVVKH